MRYLDFTLQLSSAADGGYRVEVIESPVGNTAAHLLLSLDPEAILAETGRRLTGNGDSPDPGTPLNPRKLEDLRVELGLPLFERLFTGEVREAFARSRTNIALRRSMDEDCMLRLRLHFGKPSPEAPWRDSELKRDLLLLASLPWEYLCDPATGKFLALDGALPIVRRFNSRAMADLPPVRPPIRLLVASCQPRGLDEANLTPELEAIVANLPDTFDIRPLSNPSLDDVDRAMQEHKPHIFHFLGHGGFNTATGVGHLCFVRPDGQVERRTGEEIAERFAAHPTLRLVVLNSCRPGQLPRLLEHNPFAATVTAILLSTGVPAVIAMQFPISSSAALAFSRGFYSALPAHEGVEDAVSMGRREIRFDEASKAEFGTPALYLQAQSSDLFQHEVDRDEEESTVRLAIQSFRGFGKVHARSCDAVLDLTSLFDRRFPRQASPWNEVILPRLIRFLSKQVKEERPLELVINAHQSLAFAAGYLLEAKGGISPSFYQRGQASSSYEKKPWNKNEGVVPVGELWKPFEELRRDPESTDLALAISVTQPTRPAVENYLDEQGLKVSSLYHFEVPLPGHDSVKSGAHAYRLAEALHHLLYRQPQLRRGTLHLFGSAPNAFFFFLGQHAAPWGRIQLYEFDFGAQQHKTYEPSILLDRGRFPRRGSREGINFLFS